MKDTKNPTRTVVYEDSDRTSVNSDFHLTPEQFGMNVPGPGSLDSILLVVNNSDRFGLRVETDESKLIDENFTRLEAWSDELSHIDAYTTPEDERVISVSDFPYAGLVRTKVNVFGKNLDFDWVRAVYTLGGEVDY